MDVKLNLEYKQIPQLPYPYTLCIIKSIDDLLYFGYRINSPLSDKKTWFVSCINSLTTITALNFNNYFKSIELSDSEVKKWAYFVFEKYTINQ